MRNAPDDALSGDLTWGALADMRPHRLKRGKHFALATREMQNVAQEAASILELGVHTVRDELRQYQYLWVQFADFKVPPGVPCPRCGGLRLLRTGTHFARCEACAARLLILMPKGFGGRSDPPADEQEPMSGALLADLEGAEGEEAVPDEGLTSLLKWAGRRRLDSYQDIELVRDEVSSDDRFERWYGRGCNFKGRPGILEVIYPLRHGVRVPDPNADGDDLYRVHFWSLTPFRRAKELGVLNGWPPAGFLGSLSISSDD